MTALYIACKHCVLNISDISEDSVRTCENGRYYSDKMIVRHTGRPPFDAEFIVADCCEVSLQDIV